MSNSNIPGPVQANALVELAHVGCSLEIQFPLSMILAYFKLALVFLKHFAMQHIDDVPASVGQEIMVGIAIIVYVGSV